MLIGLWICVEHNVLFFIVVVFFIVVLLFIVVLFIFVAGTGT
jgi:hypothetical protein